MNSMQPSGFESMIEREKNNRVLLFGEKRRQIQRWRLSDDQLQTRHFHWPFRRRLFRSSCSRGFLSRKRGGAASKEVPSPIKKVNQTRNHQETKFPSSSSSSSSSSFSSPPTVNVLISLLKRTSSIGPSLFLVAIQCQTSRRARRICKNNRSSNCRRGVNVT